MPIKIPTVGTLKKYGLTPGEWWTLAEVCRFTCVVCGQPFGDRPLAIDHEHAKGFKATKKIKGKGSKRGDGKRVRVRVMAPHERRRFVRGIIHNYCNRFIRRWLTLERARSIVAYLESYEQRRGEHRDTAFVRHLWQA